MRELSRGLSCATSCCKVPLRPLLQSSPPRCSERSRSKPCPLPPLQPHARLCPSPRRASAGPCRVAPRKRGDEELCPTGVRQRLGGPSSAGGKVPHPIPPPAPLSSHTNYGPVPSAATESLKTWSRCKVSPEFTDSLEAITLGGINFSFHRNKMLTGGKPHCSRQSSINAAAAAGKGEFAGWVSAMSTPIIPPCGQLRVSNSHTHTPPRCGPTPGGRGCLAAPPARGPLGPEAFGEGCGQWCTAFLLGGLNKTSVCHRLGLFIAFWRSLLQHFILRSLVILPCRVQQKCSLLLVYVFQLGLPNNLRSWQSTLPSDARPVTRALFPALALLVASRAALLSPLLSIGRDFWAKPNWPFFDLK